MFIRTSQSNRISDCLYLDAETAPLDQGNLSLRVTLNFNYQAVQTNIGTFAVGLRGGDLRLDFKNAELLDFTVTSDFQWWVEQTTEVGESGSTSDKNQSSISIAGKPTGPEAGLGASNEKSVLSSGSRKLSTQSQAWQVHAIMGDRPGWRFSTKTDAPYLEANIVSEEFAAIRKSAQDAEIELKFTTEQRYLHIEKIDGFLPRAEPIDAREKSLLGLYLWFAVLRPVVVPHLSQVVLSGVEAVDV